MTIQAPPINARAVVHEPGSISGAGGNGPGVAKAIVATPANSNSIPVILFTITSPMS
jgi:hypothetical protein